MSVCRVVVAVACVTVLAGCGQAVAGGSTPLTTGPSSRELAAVATVLQGTGKGPELCLGGVADSYPPQCGGLSIVGWDWAKAPPSERANGVRWGTYAVVGTLAGTYFTLTRPATTEQDFPGVRPAVAEPELGTPCPTPGGGWRVVDATRTNQASLDATLAAAPAFAGYAGAWVDQSMNTADPATQPVLLNDPTELVLDVATAGDVATTERALRRTWGGSLCVTHVRFTEARLAEVQDALTMDTSLRTHVLSTSIAVSTNVVQLEVDHDDGTLQARMDAAYGPGLVTVGAVLFPYVPR